MTKMPNASENRPGTDLLDINVWLALVDGNHVFHQSAEHYWNEQTAERIAFCRVTMLGFLRLSSQPRVLSRALFPAEAWRAYRSFIALPEVRFLAEEDSLEQHFADLTLHTTVPAGIWTDAYLAAFAISSGSRLVSFDSDFHSFPEANFLQLTP
jgi:toxin-antitoxin system PIN domain toxin